MKKYLYNYQTIIRFSAPVNHHFYCLRCVPGNNACQQTMRQDLFLYPSDNVCHTDDTWGNLLQYGSHLEPHDSFIFVSSGEAWLAPYRIPDTESNDVFKAQSALTRLTKEMADFADGAARNGPPLGQAMQLMQMVYDYMTYAPGTTTIDTNAGAAFRQRQGVCQDFAHIVIALCRARGIAARYVNGFIPGIGATHAWLEVLDQGAWHGIDPTHNCLIEYGYIKLSHGRDALDCQVSRGRFTGAASQQVEIRVIVEEL